MERAFHSKKNNNVQADDDDCPEEYKYEIGELDLKDALETIADNCNGEVLESVAFRVIDSQNVLF